MCFIILFFTFLNYWNSFSQNKEIKTLIVHEYTSTNEEAREATETYQLLALPPQTSGKVKTYMDYRTITNTSSAQHALQKQAYTDEYGYRRVGDSYMIALGSAYGTNIGDKYYITLDNGLTFPAILGDCKADIHTDVTNRYVESNGNIVEFIVDSKKIHGLSKVMGDVSHGGFRGKIVQILKVESEKGNG